MVVNFLMIFGCLLIFSKSTFSKQLFRNTGLYMKQFGSKPGLIESVHEN